MTNRERVPKLGKIKMEFSFTITDAPLVKSDSGPDAYFSPFKAVMTIYEERARLDLVGIRRGGGMYWPPTARFRLRGYPQYKEAPEWVLELAREAGWMGKVEPNGNGTRATHEGSN